MQADKRNCSSGVMLIFFPDLFSWFYLLAVYFQNRDAPVELSYSTESALIEFRWGAQRLVTRCLAGAYPAYHELLQQDFQHQVTLEKAPFIKAIERIAVLADKKEKTLSIRINSEAQQVSLSLFIEFGNGLEQMAAHVNSDGNLSI